MTLQNQHYEIDDTQALQAATRRVWSKADPILLELWEIKRQINSEANFDIAQLAKQANQFDLQKTLNLLRTASSQSNPKLASSS
jgi:hypothetical protein